MEAALTEEQRVKLDRAQDALGYRFQDEHYLLSAITHPSAAEGQPIYHSYERLEFLGDSILGALVAREAFVRYGELDEGGLTRIKVSLVAGSSLSDVAQENGFADFIIFGMSEQGTGKRGLHSALENVYEAIVAALYLDGGLAAAHDFVERTLFPRLSESLAREPENPKSALQEKLQEDGITPTYELIETQGPPHDRTFVTQVYAGLQALARGVGRTKKESESRAAESALKSIAGAGAEDRAQAKAQAKAAKAEARAAREQAKAEARAQKAEAKARRKEQSRAQG